MLMATVKTEEVDDNIGCRSVKLRFLYNVIHHTCVGQINSKSNPKSRTGFKRIQKIIVTISISRNTILLSNSQSVKESKNDWKC
jgi:hypothetical protein